jgi:zinc/manganese transport system substrate-binding protein
MTSCYLMGMILICVCVLLASASGCGSDAGNDGLDVIATNAIAADITRNVAGPEIDVDTLLPASASPHDYALSAKDRARLEEADVVVAWGAGLEAGFQLGDDAVELADDRDDPHIWMDPTLVAAALPGLTTALAAADPDHARAYRRRATAYRHRLDRLDAELERAYSAIPPARRKLVSSHDSIGYLVRRYGFDFVGAPFGVTPGTEPSAETVSQLIERVEREHVPAVFAEDTDDPELMDQIGREAGVEVVDDLLTEGFGGRVDSYEEMLRYDADRITGALAP